MPWSDKDALTPQALNSRSGLVFNVKDPEYGATGDGVTDDTQALKDAYAAAKADGAALFISAGTYKFTSQLLWDGEVDVGGAGRVGTILKKDGNFDGIRIDDSAGSLYRGFTVDSAGGADAAIGIEVFRGHRISMEQVLSQNQGSHGIIVRSGNLGSYRDVQTVSNSGDGFRVDSATGPVGVTANACTFVNIDSRSNTLVGINFNAGNSQFALGMVAQNNTGVGVRVDDRSSIIFCYGEANTGDQIELVAASTGNFLVSVEGSPVDNGSDNLVIDYNDSGVNRMHFLQLNAASDRIIENVSVGVWARTIPSDRTLELGFTGSGSRATYRLRHNQGSSIDLDVDGDFNADGVQANGVFHNLTVITLSADATPTVGSGNCFKTSGTTSITDFNNGVVGQVIHILATDSITITHNATVIVLNGAVNYDMTVTDTLTLTMFNDQVWHEVARSVN